MATCATCDRFPLAYTGTRWNCRASGRKANSRDAACSKWLPRPAPAIKAAEDINAIRTALNMSVADITPLPFEFGLIPQPPPLPGLRGRNGGVVYFVDCQTLTKIGTTDSPVQWRMKGMTTDNPFPLTLRALVCGGVSVEREAHCEFAAYRKRGEWFELDAAGRGKVLAWVQARNGETYADVDWSEQ